MITQIGLVAGEIWEYLDDHGKEGSLAKMVDELSRDNNLILMSIGWLAREGHISLEGDAPDYTVRLTGEKEKKEV